ncbi:MAG: SGNH/GDSL hydrolase family protein [Elusimicrobia bacterium]|nr:SGNH/GDSL hydrolase family protein [Elusimicrobiota bacterium]
MPLFLAAALLVQSCAAEKLIVLFIGNSFTSVNDLPGTVSRVAKSRGDQVESEARAPGGQSLEGHAHDPITLEKIREAKWDFVVLQDQSQRPAFSPEQVDKEVIPFAVSLNDAVHAARPAAKTVFYETWGRRNGDQDNCKELPTVCTYEGMQTRLSQSYALMAAKTAGLLAPVGTAWRKVRRWHHEIDLYAADGIHPSPAGTYLAACVFYDVLFKKTSAGADAAGLTPAEAAVLQKAADDAVRAPPRR